MMQSLVDMYAEGGWLPIFPCWNSYTAAMIGDHCSVVLADAYIKGIRNFDYEKAYEGMRKNAFESPASIEDYKNGMGRRALQSYLKYGYIPLEDNVKEAFHQNGQVSRTLEYAFDDFAVAQMAKALGQTADYDALMKRSQNYRNVINPKTGYAQGRYANGKFDQTKDYFPPSIVYHRGARRAITHGMCRKIRRDLSRCLVAKSVSLQNSIACSLVADIGTVMNLVIKWLICLIMLVNRGKTQKWGAPHIGYGIQRHTGWTVW
jgi:hypothetical protein